MAEMGYCEMIKHFNQIKDYQKQLGYDFDKMSMPERMQMFRNYMAALTVEQGELAAEVPFKPWRSIADQDMNYSKACLEWVDMYFFLFDQAIAIGLEPQDLADSFDLKMKVNLERITSKYNNLE